MTFKDLIRIIRRRYHWALLTAVIVFAVFYASSSWTTPSTHWTARARVMVDAPEAIQMAEKAPGRLVPHPLTQATWIKLMVEDEVSRRVDKHLGSSLPQDAIDRIKNWKKFVKVTPEEGTLLANIEASGPNEESAVALANAWALAAEEYSQERAVEVILKSAERAAMVLEDRKKDGREIQAKMNELLSQAGLEDLPLEYRLKAEERAEAIRRKNQIKNELQAINSRIQDTDRKRSEFETINRTAFPRNDADFESAARQDREVQSVEKEIRLIHRELLESRRKYKQNHPTITKLKRDLMERQAELTQVQIQALTGHLDREYLELQTKRRLLEIEQETIQSHIDERTREIHDLRPSYQAYERFQIQREQNRQVVDDIARAKARLDGATAKGYVRFEQEAKSASETAPPSKNRMILLVALVSLLIGGGVAYLMEIMDTRIRNDYDVRRHLNLPVISAIPKVRQADTLILDAARGTGMAEEFDRLATMMGTVLKDKALKILSVVSPVRQEGKTSISINVAVAAARQGKRTLLVDADLRIPRVHQMLRLPNAMGLSNLLMEQVGEEESATLYQDCGIENLRVITAGPTPENPYSLLDPERVRPVIDQLRDHFDLIVIDTPPVLLTGDAIKVASLSDGSLLVLGADETDHYRAISAKHLLENVSAKIIGVLLNKLTETRERYYYYYYEQYYGKYHKSTRR